MILASKDMSFDLEVYISSIDPIVRALEMLELANLPNTQQAIQDSLTMVQSTWQQVASRTFKHSTGRYMNSILIDDNYDEELAGRVFSNHPAARYLEDGTEPFDMKKMLHTSSKVRIGKDGTRYLIIPFRHGTPGTTTMAPMSDLTHKISSKMAMSNITGLRMESNVNKGNAIVDGKKMTGVKSNVSGKLVGDDMVIRRTYDWGGRVGKGEKIPKNERGMTRMNTSSGKAKSSEYITFRIMSEKSSKWKNPGISARHIAKTASVEARNAVYTLVEKGVAEDVKNIKEMMNYGN